MGSCEEKIYLYHYIYISKRLSEITRKTYLVSIDFELSFDGT